MHGFSVPYYIWEPTFAALVQAGLRVLRYDLYGRGYSDSLSEKAREAIPQVELHAIDDAGHISHYERPEIVNPILLEFLQK